MHHYQTGTSLAIVLLGFSATYVTILLFKAVTAVPRKTYTLYHGCPPPKIQPTIKHDP